MKLAVIGTGYVGLVTGACLAETGHHVICADIDANKILQLQNGIIPIYEPGLEEVSARNRKTKRLHFTTDIGEAIQNAQIVMIAVGTPSLPSGSADLSAVFAVADIIAENWSGYKVIVNKSTVPIGTADRVRERIGSRVKGDFDVVSNPEFLKEGDAVNDFMKPDRIVIGVGSARAEKLMRELYTPFVRTGHPVIVMDVRSAELTKYAANGLLATKITFMNEMANLCERVGADITRVRLGIGSDKRIGEQFLFPGVGYGGSCFPKDVKAIIKTSRENGVPLKILEAVDEVNAHQRLRIAVKVTEHYGEDLSGKTFALWGLAFKARTDDMREAASIYTIENLSAKGAKIRAYDPQALAEARKIFEDRIAYFEDSYEAARGADALLILTEWAEFREPDFEVLKNLLRESIIFDGRNLYEPARMQEMGFTYYSIGRA
ncbi:MAG: UDP-glucose/GDP-mannose dehydrogenase family protein [bacterium]